MCLHLLTVSVPHERNVKNVLMEFFCDFPHDPLWRWSLSLSLEIVLHNSGQAPPTHSGSWNCQHVIGQRWLMSHNPGLWLVWTDLPLVERDPTKNPSNHFNPLSESNCEKLFISWAWWYTENCLCKVLVLIRLVCKWSILPHDTTACMFSNEKLSAALIHGNNFITGHWGNIEQING